MSEFAESFSEAFSALQEAAEILKQNGVDPSVYLLPHLKIAKGLRAMLDEWDSCKSDLSKLVRFFDKDVIVVWTDEGSARCEVKAISAHRLAPAVSDAAA